MVFNHVLALTLTIFKSKQAHLNNTISEFLA